MRVLNAFREAITQSVYPKICAGCGLRGTWLCDFCAGTVLKLDCRICPRCGSPRFGIICEECPRLSPAILKARAIYPYDGWVASAIQRLKYHGEWERAERFGDDLAQVLDGLGEIDGLVPVPTHASRLRERGFNQAELIARAASERIEIPVMLALERTRKTAPQVRKSGDDRRTNVLHAFALSHDKEVHGKRLVLIDDVRTTAATLNACAEVLVKAGATEVQAVTVAIDMSPDRIKRWIAAVKNER